MSSILSNSWKAFSQKNKKNNPASPASKNLIENTDYQRSEVDLEPDKFTIPECKFPSPTGPVGIQGFSNSRKIVNGETYLDNSDQDDIHYEINDKENDYEEIETLLSPIVEMIAIPQKPDSLPYYVSHMKEKRADPEPEPVPEEPTEEYMDMVEAKELREDFTGTTPTSHVPPLAATPKITKRDSELKTELLAHMNKFENNKVSKVVPPIRRTIHHLTVHSHCLSILREEYQNTPAEPPKRVTSLSTNEESGFIKEIKEEIKGKSPGYEKVPDFKQTKAPNKATKPKVAIPKTELATKNEFTKVAKTNDEGRKIEEESRSRAKSIKILNTDPTLNLDKPPSPTKNVPPKREENTILSHSPSSQEHCTIPANIYDKEIPACHKEQIPTCHKEENATRYKPKIPTPNEQDISPNETENPPTTPTKITPPKKSEKPILLSSQSGDFRSKSNLELKSCISNIGVKLNQDSAETEHIPSKLIENRIKRRNTETEKRTVSPQLSDLGKNLYKQEIPTPNEQDFSPNKPENVFYLRQDVLSNDLPKPPIPTKIVPPKKNEKLESCISNIEVKLNQDSAETEEHIPSKLIENRNKRRNTETAKRTVSPQLSDSGKSLYKQEILTPDEQDFSPNKPENIFCLRQDVPSNYPPKSDKNMYKQEIPTPNEQDFSPKKPENVFYLRQDVLSNDPPKPPIPTKIAPPKKNEKLESCISNIEVKLNQDSAETEEHIPSKLIENRNKRRNTETAKRTVSPQLSDLDKSLYKQEIPTPNEQDFSPNKPENIFYIRQDVLSNDSAKPSKPVAAIKPKPVAAPEPEAVPAPGPKHKQKPIPATGPKPRRTNSCKSIPSGDERSSTTKDEFTNTPLKFSNELQKQFEKMNVEPNHYV